MTKQEQITIISHKKGYYVNSEGDIYNKKGRKISLHKTRDGYLSFTIRFNNIPTRSFVHRLQAYQKFGDVIFKKGIQVRHKNGISFDNSYNNILIGSASDNRLDIPEEMRILYASHPLYDHKSIISDRKKGLTYREIMKKYNISSKGTVFFIINKSIEKITNGNNIHIRIRQEVG